MTTCLRRGEIEIATTFESGDQSIYASFLGAIEQIHGPLIFSHSEATIDDVVSKLLGGKTIATAESCTGGLLSGRLADKPGASAYLLGGVVSYSNDVKTEALGVDADLISENGAVSGPVARAMASGVRSKLGSDLGVSVTGIAGPGGGTEEKPVGSVWFAVTDGTDWLVRDLVIPGGRADVRDRSTTIALHLIRRFLLGEHDGPAS